DVMIAVDQLPKREEDVHVSRQKLSLGGCAFNVVNLLHHLELPYTFISPVGSGIYGQFVHQELEKIGIQSPISLSGENGCCYCFVEPDGERTFVSYHGVEYLFDPAWIKDINHQVYDYIYVCGLEVEEETGRELVEALSFLEGQIVFCPGPRVDKIDSKRLKNLLSLSPIVHLNKAELLLWTGKQTISESLRILYQQTENMVVVTKGEDGALFYDGDNILECPAYPSQVLNTIGAGDSHVAGLIAGLFNGLEVADALDFANYVSSQVVASPSVQLSSENYQRINHRLQTAKKISLSNGE
ncbi:carbohydrate kinase family protein, partial [Streptococcus moroccensis]